MQRMLIPLLLLSVLFGGCAVADDADGPDSPPEQSMEDRQEGTDIALNMEILKRGTQGALASDIDSEQHSEPFIEIASDHSTLRSLWDQYIGRGDVPSVSFDRSIVAFLLMPAQPTGGYSIDPEGISATGGTVEIDATIRRPGPNDIVTQAFTAPYAVIAVEQVDPESVEAVEWMDQGRRVATRSVEP
ncbi:MAG: protease complex subunit PrcB family protein [Thermoanaerobaculia bacterium]|nr:protease complex subunit PrcB family protein [Thermoanaerobaculia bacterium]